MFEMGWLLVQIKVHDEQSRIEILQDVRYGFWAWWLSVFIQHDAMLNQNYTSPGLYHRQKEKLVHSIEIDFTAANFLNI